MALLAANAEVVKDEDLAFYRVDTRTPPHELAKGVCADATNKRFEDGRACPRFGISCQPWGQIPGNNLIPAAAAWLDIEEGGNTYNLVGLNPGQTYVFQNNSTLVMNLQAEGGSAEQQLGNINPGQSLTFTLLNTNNTLFITAYEAIGGPQPPLPNPVAAYVSVAQNNPIKVCGYVRFNDPQSFDTTVVLTDDWRTLAGEDGGRGRAWRIQSGNAPMAIPMNGNDIYGVTRLVACYNGLVMLRQDNERHYFQGPAVAASKIQLNCEPDWNTGDLVFVWGDETVNSAFTAGTSPPALNTTAFVKNEAGNAVSLWQDASLTIQLNFTAARGRFYLERQATNPGYFGNGAWPLIAQPSVAGATLWEAGFIGVPVNLQVTATAAATGVWTVPNHRLIPGDAVTLSGMQAGDTPVNTVLGPPATFYYVYPLGDHTFQLFDTQNDALLAAQPGNTVLTGLQAIHLVAAGPASVPLFTKAGASGLPMPPAREGYYMDNGQLVLVNGNNNILISDPLDPLHYTPMQSGFTANLGESDPVVAVGEISSSNTLIIVKQNSVMALYNFSQGAGSWNLQSVTREYGCVAPLSLRQWGSSLMFLSRRGLDSVQYTAFGVIIGTEKAVSFDMYKYHNLVDWNYASLAVVETWNDRLFLAYPMKGQVPGQQVNNAVLSLNFLNSDAQQGTYGWEGNWTGAALGVFGFARLTLYGEERLTFCNYAAQVCWLDDGWFDLGRPIADSLTTRRYTGGNNQRKIWQQALVNWDSNGSTLTVSAVAPGWNEVYALTPPGGLHYDRTQYVAGEGPAYNPATQVPPFNNPFREDYTLAGAGELIGGQPDIHQNIPETFRMRVDDWGVQLVIANAAGSTRLVSVLVAGFAGPGAATRIV